MVASTITENGMIKVTEVPEGHIEDAILPDTNSLPKLVVEPTVKPIVKPTVKPVFKNNSKNNSKKNSKNNSKKNNK